MAKKSSRDSKNGAELPSRRDAVGSVANWSSQELLSGLRRQDDRVATEVFDRYAERLLALARARISPRIRKRIDEDDVVQSVYRSFFICAEAGEFALSNSGDLWRLLARITLHKLYHQVEKHTAARRDVHIETTDDSFSADIVNVPEPTPAQVIAIVEQLHIVAKLLTKPEREVLAANLQGASVAQISVATHKSQRTVRRLLETSRQKFERTLQSESGSLTKSSDSIRYAAHPLATLRYADYVLDRLIGAGGMGKVYRARNRNTGDTVAIKALPKSRLADDRVIERFLQEAQILARLNHAHIVGFRGVGRFPGGGHFIVMDFIDADNLQTRIERAPIDTGEALHIAQKVASAVAHAHERRIVHGDMKPANVLYGNDGRVVVTDFGLAHFITDRVAPNAPRWMVGGTAGYIAPEVRDHGEAPTVAADVYGFGAFLWALMTGAPPDRRQDLSHPGVPPGVAAFCNSCLCVEPAKRFQSLPNLLLNLPSTQRC